MRLLNTKTRKLEEFGGDDIPLYAILSHTWGKIEIAFQDIEGGNAEEKAEYEKVRNTCALAAAHGFDYVWIDTCCIDKTSSAELSEAINSMYRWYQDSAVCYAYLADVSLNCIDHQSETINPGFSNSRWFTRGWTLQELIAPSVVIILNQEWQEIGTKMSLKWMISKITRIPIDILSGDSLEGASVAQRMSWASHRRTTRIEDLAYCLIGMFGINMPLLYGEGERAFTRLQEEIIKVSDDHSLFAWKETERRRSLLATSPAAFFNSGEVIPHHPSNTLSGAITVNNKGIHLKLYFKNGFRNSGLAILPCTKNERQVAIYLKALSETEDYFVRIKSDNFVLLDNIKDFSQSEYHEKSLCVQLKRQIYMNQSALPMAAEEGREAVVKLLVENGAKLETVGGWLLGRTPLSLAALNGHEAVVKLLVEKGAELEAKDKAFGQTPLSFAAMNGHKAVVKLLVENGAELEAKDEALGRTPLSWAAVYGHEAVVRLLLENGAELETGGGGRLGRTPLSLAALSGHEAVVKLLVEKGANLEADGGGQIRQTPLSLAAAKGHEAVVRLLVENGAELESKDVYGRKPLLRAAGNGHEAVVKLLQQKEAQYHNTS